MDLPNPKLFFSEKSFAYKVISKNEVTQIAIFTGRNALFLKSINNILLLIIIIYH